MAEGNAFVLERSDTDGRQICTQLLRVAAEVVVVAETKPGAERRRAKHCERREIGRRFADVTGDYVADDDNQIRLGLHEIVNDAPKRLRSQENPGMNIGDEKQSQRREATRPSRR